MAIPSGLLVPGDAELFEQAKHFGDALMAQRLKLATAESCTGGWVSKIVTEVPGCSDWFDCAFVAYSYEAKESALGVPRVEEVSSDDEVPYDF